MGAQENRGDVQQALHSLTGGDSEKLRGYLECLFKNGKLSPEEQGILMHAYGDAYAHSHPTGHNEWVGKGRRPLPWDKGRGLDGWKYVQDGERQYPPFWGHGPQGHLPDYIAVNPELYGRYVDRMFGVMQGLNPGGQTNPALIAALKKGAFDMTNHHNWRFTPENEQNASEIEALLKIGRDNGAAYGGGYRPENHNGTNSLNAMPFSDKDWRGWGSGNMMSLINKIKKGVDGCCPPK
jgi:hypothetical protein